MTQDFHFTRPGLDYARTEWSREANFIWHPENGLYFEIPINGFCFFRKEFETPGSADAVLLRITADSKYMLYVNGEYVARGPCRSDPRWQYFDEIDISGFLHAGVNCIGILALHYGYGTGQTMERVQAVAAECRTVRREQESVVTATGRDWRCLVAECYDSNAPRVNGRQGPIEIFDGREYPEGWHTPGYDDSTWKPASVLRPANNSPFWNLLPREIPMLKEEVVQAEGIRYTGTTFKSDSTPVHRALMMEIENARLERAVEAGKSTGTESAMPRFPYTVPAAEDSDPRDRGIMIPVAVADLGKILAGYLRIEIAGPEGATVDAVYAEELWNGKPVIDEQNRPMDRFILRHGRNVFEVAFGWKAFRYVYLTVRPPGCNDGTRTDCTENGDHAIIIHGVGIRTRGYPLEDRAEFAASDPLVTRIRDLCVHTVGLCMQDGFLDSSSREQQQWIGDGRWQALCNYYIGGDPRLHRKMLSQVGQSQDWEGMIKPRHPDDHNNVSPIPSFCLAWVSSFHDYIMYTGDTAVLDHWWPNIVHALRWFTAFENAQGLLQDVPYWMFIDWGDPPNVPDVGRGGIITPLNCQYVEALRAAAAMAAMTGDERAEAIFAERAERTTEAIRGTLWDDDRGAYVDCIVRGKRSAIVSEPTNALALLHIHDPSDPRIGRIFDHVFSPAVTPRVGGLDVVVGESRPEDGLEAGSEMKTSPDSGTYERKGETESAGKSTVTPASPYMMVQLFRALAKVGKAGRAMEIMRERYGRLLRTGATAVWERWLLIQSTDGKHAHIGSASHAWGSTPIIFLSEGILGIRPLEPGFRRFSFNPDLCGLQKASGKIPTPAGPISVSLRRDDPGNQIQAELTIPAGLRCVTYPSGQNEEELPSGNHTLHFKR
jgi:alpha-L-rhamnosidase